MRYIKQTLLMIFASMALVACGGGTDDTPDQKPAGGNISAGTDFRATKFPAIVVNGTATLTDANIVMASAPTAGASTSTSSGGVYTYTWTTGSGNTLEVITITSAGNGATSLVLTKNYRNADGVAL